MVGNSSMTIILTELKSQLLGPSDFKDQKTELQKWIEVSNVPKKKKKSSNNKKYILILKVQSKEVNEGYYKWE